MMNGLLLLLLLISLRLSESSLCYDEGSSEFELIYTTALGRKRLLRLSPKTGYGGQTEIKGIEATDCQDICHRDLDCAGLEYSQYDYISDESLSVPVCRFYSRISFNDMITTQGNTAFIKRVDDIVYGYCGSIGEVCSCATKVRLGFASEWVHMDPGYNSEVLCTPETFGLTAASPKAECQCSTHDGLLLYLDASSYISGDIWMDRSGNNHFAYLSHHPQKLDSSAPTFVSASLENPAHFNFDGNNDWLPVKDLFFKSSHHIMELTVVIAFRTTYGGQAANSNWALIDFDRSVFFNIYVRGDNGRLGFSTTGGGHTHDMFSSESLNDGIWHTVMCTYSNSDREKVIYIDGIENYRIGVSHNGGIGATKTRFGMIGEGSQADSQFGSGNGYYFHGDIAKMEIYTSVLYQAPYSYGTSPVGTKDHCDSFPQCIWTSLQDPNSFITSSSFRNSVSVSVANVPVAVFPMGLPGKKESSMTVTMTDLDYESDFLDVLYIPNSAEWYLTDHGLFIDGVYDMEEWNYIIPSIMFFTTSTILTPRSVSWNSGSSNYSPETGNYYQFFEGSLTWYEARNACNQRLFGGAPGYLATITSSAENAVVESCFEELQLGTGWIGLSDISEEGTWRWITGPEGEEDGGLGRILGRRSGDRFVLSPGGYANWRNGEPNDQGLEDFGHMYLDGDWNDFHVADSSIGGYICEWDGESVHSGSITIELSACVLRPCNHKKEAYCIREKDCSWSAKTQECFPTCEKNYYTDNCNVYCLAEDTCSSHGRCGETGICVCDTEWGGPRCKWPKHQCIAWGDTHYTSFSGDKFDFRGVDATYVVYATSTFRIVAKHYRCGGTSSDPVACMKQIQIETLQETIEVNIDVGHNPSEYGRFHVNGDVTEVATLTLPITFTQVTLVNFHVGSATHFSYTFEAQTSDTTHTRVKITQDSSWKAPQLNVFVDHFGSTSLLTGLCVGSCNSQSDSFVNDCTMAFGNQYECIPTFQFTCQFATDVSDEMIPFCKTTCSVDSPPCTRLSLSWASECCSKYKTCGGQEQYEQCVFENCNMGWVGTPEASHCVRSFEDVLLEQNVCGEAICQVNREGPSCERCRENFFGSNCELYCDPKVMCSGRGICNSQGGCWCDAGFGYSDEENNKYCLHICQKQTTQSSCKSRGTLCRWSADAGLCLTACQRGSFGPTCTAKCNPDTTCSGHGSCAMDGTCNCKKNWGGNDCSVGKYTCAVWGDPHYTTFSGRRYDFFGPPGDDKQYDLYSTEMLHVYAKHWKCNNRATCMKRVSIWDERGGSIEMLLDGQIKINCTTYTQEQLLSKLQFGHWDVLPRHCPEEAQNCTNGNPVRLIAAKRTVLGRDNAITYVFDVREFGTKRFEIQLAARSNAVDAYITHYGEDPLQVSTGLCLGEPGSGKPGTGEVGCYKDNQASDCTGEWCRTGPPPCAVAMAPNCLPGALNCGFCPTDPVEPSTTFWRCDEPSSQTKAENCCIKLKGCNSPNAYEQCIWDECALGSDNSCLDNYKAAMDFDDQNMEESCACDKPHKAIDYETGECTKCKANWYSAECSQFCSASITCNGHGECDANGLCWCDYGYAGDECLMLPPDLGNPSHACLDQVSQANCSSIGVCVWSTENLFCSRSSQAQCWEYTSLEECVADGCYWSVDKTSWDTCVTAKPEEQSPPACIGIECPTTFIPLSVYVGYNCLAGETCLPAKVGDEAVFYIEGYPSRKVFPTECNQLVVDFIARTVTQIDISDLKECSDGWVAVITQDKSCSELVPEEVLSDSANVLYYAPVYMVGDATRTSLSFIYSNMLDSTPWYTVCYIPPLEFAEKLPTAITRECSSHFVQDNTGKCKKCEKDWFGPDCDTFCHPILTCTGHGTCKTVPAHDDVCNCNSGWVDQKEYNLECFSPDPSHHTVPAPYEPPVYVPKFADLTCSDVECSTGFIQITGVPPRGFVNTCSPKCVMDGTASIVKMTGSCSNPDEGDILARSIPISHTPNPDIRSSANITISFNVSQIPFQVCYRPQTSPAPKSVLLPVSTKLRKMTAVVNDSPTVIEPEVEPDTDSPNSSSSYTVVVIVSIVTGGLVCTVLGVMFFRRSRSSDGDSLANDIYLAGDFADSKLEELAPIDPDVDSAMLDDFDFDGIEP